jgi:uncharacterized protein
LLFNRFYFNRNLTKDEVVATRAANELLLHIIKLFLYAGFGLLTSAALRYGILISLAAILASLCTKKVLAFINERLFQKTGYAAMVLSGVFMFSGAITHMNNKDNLAVNFYPINNGQQATIQWRQSHFVLELEYDEGFEMEWTVPFAELPAATQQIVKQKLGNNKSFLVEEVIGFRKRYYELYVKTPQGIIKYNIP